MNNLSLSVINGMDDEIDDLTYEVKRLRKIINSNPSELHQEIKKLENEIFVLESNNNLLLSKIHDLTEQLSTNPNVLQRQIIFLKNRIKNLKDDLDSSIEEVDKFDEKSKKLLVKNKQLSDLLERYEKTYGILK